MVISYVHSATVLVRDQAAAVDFYVNTLGFEKRMDNPFGEHSRWIVVGPPGGQAGLALLKPEDVGQDAESARGSTGISFIADDVQATYDQLVARGVTFTSPPQQMPWGATATWFNDPDGNNYFLTDDTVW
ncbi:MAG TPA: VOC family protein [Thermomicrobiaceae bacterium]|nr:VOC family protein [Thermomicrobiaceae bacterium]